MKSWPICALVLLSLSVLLSGLAPADEPPVTPRLKPGQGKLERGDRLRRIGGRLIDALENAPGGKSQPLDVGKLNEVIGELLGPLLQQDAEIEHLHFGFDPEETDFAKDKVKFVASAGLKRSAWSSLPTEMEFDLQTSLVRSDGAPKAIMEGHFLLNTEVIPFANYVMARLAARMGQDGSPLTSLIGGRGEKKDKAAGRPTPDERFRAQVAERLARSEGISNMDDLVDLIIDVSGLRLSTINAEIEQLSLEASRNASDDKEHKRLLEQLNEARIQRDKLFDLRPRVERDEQGHAVAFVVTGEQFAAGSGPQVERLDVFINDQQISVRTKASLAKGVEAYALFKPLVLSTLDRLQQRDEGALNLGRGLLDSSFPRAREFLHGHAQPAASSDDDLPAESELPAEPDAE